MKYPRAGRWHSSDQVDERVCTRQCNRGGTRGGFYLRQKTQVHTRWVPANVDRPREEFSDYAIITVGYGGCALEAAVWFNCKKATGLWALVY